ncbi:MAG: hypothetical protein AB7T14_04460 [Candidatus Methylacidiphilaceae bacterium]
MLRSLRKHGFVLFFVVLIAAATSTSGWAETDYYPLKEAVSSSGKKAGQLSPDGYLTVSGGKIAVWSSSPNRPFRRIGLLGTNYWNLIGKQPRFPGKNGGLRVFPWEPGWWWRHAAGVAAKNGGDGLLPVGREEERHVAAWVGRKADTLRFNEFRYWWVIVGPHGE